MSQLVIFPILLPLLFGGVLLAMGERKPFRQRRLAQASCALQLFVAVLLAWQAGQGTTVVYSVGNWAPPFGIVLVLDRLAALMLLVTATLALPALIYACAGDDRHGRYFHALFQMQLLGINGAFLTGDLFNLFVFFEVLLIASYALLLHGRTSERVRASIPYVLLNLAGSALFLIAIGTLYGLSGTLNMADLAVFIAVAEGDTATIVGAAGLVLLVVFSLKAALLPLHCWLPAAYGSASPSVAALFAIMTKIGIYSILRLATLVFSAEAGELADLLLSWLWPTALVTIAIGTCGALAASTLQRLIAYLVVVSVGTLTAGIAIGSVEATAAGLYYLIHTTWVSGALFLLTGVIDLSRGSGSLTEAGPGVARPQLTGTLFFVAAVAVVGLPPLSGFIGKVLLMQAAPAAWAPWLWPILLGSSLLVLVALSRAGSTLFWRTSLVIAPVEHPLTQRLVAATLLLVGAVALALAGQPVLDYLAATAAQLHNPADYTATVLSLVPSGGQP